MNAKKNRHQTIDQTIYSAHDLLIRTGEDLPHYQDYIADLFVQEARRIKAVRVLDFGAGTGDLASRFRRKSGLSPQLLEIDETLREICVSRNFIVQVRTEDVSGQLDLIYSSNVLEHIEDDERAVSALAAKLRPGGKLALYLPANMHLWTRMDDVVGHFRRYERAGLRALLERSGLEIEQLGYRDSLGAVVTLLYKIFPDRDGQPSSRSLKFYDRVVFPLSRLLDFFLHGVLGKNIFVVARKPQ